MATTNSTNKNFTAYIDMFTIDGSGLMMNSTVKINTSNIDAEFILVSNLSCSYYGDPYT